VKEVLFLSSSHSSANRGTRNKHNSFNIDTYPARARIKYQLEADISESTLYTTMFYATSHGLQDNSNRRLTQHAIYIQY
jgi:hypothetical protein